MLSVTSTWEPVRKLGKAECSSRINAKNREDERRDAKVLAAMAAAAAATAAAVATTTVWAINNDRPGIVVSNRGRCTEG